MDIIIVPYIEEDGVRSFKDSFVMELYRQAKEEGRADMAFPGKSVTDAKGFLNAMKYGPNQLYIVHDKTDLLGFCWLNNFLGRTAYLHMCAFQIARGKVAEVSRKVLDILFDIKNLDGDGYVYDMLIGLTQASNTAISQIVEAIGGVYGCILPEGSFDSKENKSVPAKLCYFIREASHGE